MIKIQRTLKPVSSSFTYLNAGGEQTVLEILNSKNAYINTIFIDVNTLTQDGTFKFYSKIDGVNYREMTPLAFAIATSKKAFVLNSNFVFIFPVSKDFKITYTETVDEGADRTMPFIYTLEG
jgi:hypothetical protein